MKWRDRSGLSLMELLVALVLVAIIATGLASATGLGVSLLDRTSTLPQSRVEIAMRTRLRYWLASATSGTRIANFPTNLRGDAQTLTFTTFAPTPFAPDSTALRLTVDGSGSDLVLEINHLGDDGSVVQSDKRNLARNISEVAFSYYSDDPEDPGWREVWNTTDRLPAFVRIMAAPGSEPFWPEFIVKLVLAQPR